MRTSTRINRLAAVGLAFGLSGFAWGQVFPNQPHAAYNFIPLGNHVCTYHQVYAAAQFGSTPIEIRSLGFAPNTDNNNQTVTYNQLRISVGYTDRAPGGLSSNLPDNPRGTLTEVFNSPGFQHTINSSGTEDFSMILRFTTPFCYDPNSGNLLIEIHVDNSSVNNSTSRCAGVPDASRAYNSTVFGNGADNVAQRMLFEIGPCSGGGFTIRLSGPCPGQKTLSWDGAGSGQMGILIANGSGNCVIPGGPCSGTQLGLGCAGLSLYNVIGTQGGTGQVSTTVGTQACGKWVQCIKTNDCSTSNATGPI